MLFNILLFSFEFEPILGESMENQGVAHLFLELGKIMKLGISFVVKPLKLQ